MSKPSAWWVAVVASGVVTGCNEGSSVPLAGSAPVASGSQLPACETFSTNLTLLDRMSQPTNTFNVGEDIFPNMRVTNNAPYPVTMQPAYSCAMIVFEVFSQTTKLWSNDTIMCSVGVPERTYAPYESVYYSQALDSFPGPPSWPSGAYTVKARVGLVKDNQGQWVDCGATLDKQASFNIL